MAATASTMLDLTNKATNLTREISSGWYKASQAMDSFPVRLTELRLRSNMYTSLLNKYGMEDDPFIEPLLMELIKLLDEEEVKLQRLQDNCCLGMGKKLVFPDSVIIALDGVLEAFQRLPEHIKTRESLAEQLERSSNSKARLLPFLQDEKYVPLEKSVLDVRTALESETSPRIVVISGGPGQGKSSMARYLACLYQDGMATIRQAQRVPEPASSSLNLPPQNFENGVIFLRCGAKMNTKSLLMQLWQDMGFQGLPLPTTSKPELAGDQNDSREEESILKQLSARLRNQKVLIVLDDVWDPATVEKLMVQGERVKYLVTTQVQRLRTDAIEIKISKPNKQEANCIIANYVIGYPEEISTDIQMEIDLIIEESDFNPLLLANVATSLQDGDASDLSEWKSTRKYLADLQDGDEKRPVSLYGRSYSKLTMGASMEMALNSFSSEEQTLVLLASTFESQPIPEGVFKILFKILHSSLARFSKSSKLLERNNFIQIESISETPIWGSSRRSWSIHAMRQKFISGIKEKEIVLMFTKLCQQVEHINIVAMLFVLYGLRPWCDEAARKLGIPRKQFEDDHITGKSFPPWIIKPFVWLLHADSQDVEEKQSHQLATQVLHKYLHSSELDVVSISNLLEKPKIFSTTCEALFETQILDDMAPSFKIGDGSSSALKVLVANLAQNTSPLLQHQAILTLAIISHNMIENALQIGSFPHAMERLVELLEEGTNTKAQGDVAWTLGISKDMVENAVKIGSFPLAMERLMGLLKEGLSPEAQRYASWTLGIISKNVVENAVKIGSSPHAVERLVGLLKEGMSPQAQKNATQTLGIISKDVVENAMKIGSSPHAVERLVGLLKEGMSPQAQKNVAQTLGIISAKVMENALKIGSFPHAAERLVGLLKEGISPQAQENGAWTLGVISKHVVENAMKIGSSPHAVERLVGLLDKGMKPKSQAAWTLGIISEDVENAVKIGSFPHAVERLVGLLKEGMTSKAQLNGVWTLGVISEHVVENAMKIGSSPHVMERLVRLLCRDGGDDKFHAMIITCMWRISYCVGENQVLLRRATMEEPSCMEILASCASSKSQGNVLSQYFGAQVYHLVNAGNGEELKYESSMAYEGQGDFKVMKEDYIGALQDYENGLAIDKEDLLGVLQRGVLHSKISFVKAKLGDLQGALADANEFLHIGNDCRPHGLQERGILRRLMGDWPGALADLDEALHLETDDYEMLKHRGLVKFLLNDADGARADAEWALRVKPARVDAYSYGRGACFGTSSVEYLGYKLK